MQCSMAHPEISTKWLLMCVNECQVTGKCFLDSPNLHGYATWLFMNSQTLTAIIFLPVHLDFKVDRVTLILLKLFILCRQSEFAELALEAWVCQLFELAILLYIRWASHCHTRPWQSIISHAETPLHRSFAYGKLQLTGMQLLLTESWWIMRCCQCASLLAKW